jgi:hypothetical protein
MLDDVTAGAAVPAPRCTWCSAELPSNHETICPSCGATLLGDGETQVPGLTAIDAEAILRNARASKAKPRSRILSWISGEYDEDQGGATAPPGSLSPPPAAVRREILRLELEAQVANAQAEVEAMAADAAVEEGEAQDLAAASVAEGAEPIEAADAPVASGETAAEPDSDEAPPA